MWSSGGGTRWSAGSTQKWDATHDAQKAQGWTPFVLDTNGNGKRDAYTEPGEPQDPTKDMRINAGFYGVAPNPGGRLDLGLVGGLPGRDRAACTRTQSAGNGARGSLSAAMDDPKAPMHGYSPRGMDIDHNGVVWTVLASGHFASFDRRKCKGPLNGPDRDRQAVSRRLDALSVPGAAIPRREGYRAAPRPAITPGSISSTRSAWARTCRSPPAMRPIRCWRWWTENG